VRVALGAERRDIMTLVVGRSARFCAIGLALGVGGALAVSRYVKTLLFGITATDVSTYVMVSAILFAVALLATFVPALRAMRVNPLVALRSE
jgi:putative ABC transport system permease protein